MTLQELQNATTALTVQVANITTELVGFATILKSIQDKMDNAETDKLAPPAKATKTDGAAAASC